MKNYGTNFKNMHEINGKFPNGFIIFDKPNLRLYNSEALIV